MDCFGLSDEELMKLYQNGSDVAFRVIYERHSSKILSFILAKVQKKEVANEIFQEVFVKIHKSKHLYNQSLPLLPWIFTITRNTVFDYFRRGNKVETPTPIELIDKSFESQDSCGIKFDFDPILVKLPTQQKLAVEMRYYDEKTFEEIASVLNTSPLNIRKLVSRGIKRIKEIIKEGG